MGLNPHAGENGLLGEEENNVIIPVIREFTQNGNVVIGPFPTDGFFANGSYKKFDGILAMYHDQGLIPFKTLATGEGVNFTAGLPAVRTSPDHGVAFDIAGKDKADPSSFMTAIFECIDIINRRNGFLESRKNPLRKMTPSILANAKDEIIEE